MKEQVTRINEWFVPQFGPIKFRIFVGMMFLPYTGMCISFSIIGSLLSPTTIAWDRMVAIIIIYFTALGISAHAADSMGSKNRPWGNYFSNLITNNAYLWINYSLCNWCILHNLFCSIITANSYFGRFFPICI